MEDVISTDILILTTESRLEPAEIHKLRESLKRKKQGWGLNSGLWAPRHKLGTTEPRRLFQAVHRALLCSRYFFVSAIPAASQAMGSGK